MWFLVLYYLWVELAFPHMVVVNIVVQMCVEESECKAMLLATPQAIW